MANKTEWYAEGKELVKGVVSLKKKGYGPRGTGFDSEWTIDLDELARITNGHPEFNEKVKSFLDEKIEDIHNAVVYRSFNKNDDNREHIGIVFDVADTYIAFFGCSPDHADGRTHVIATSYNKSYIWQMASLL